MSAAPEIPDTEGLVEFLNETARYFENRPTGGEDRAHWANVYNAENARKAAAELSRLRGLNSELCDNYNSQLLRISRMQDALTTLTEDNKRLREVLACTRQRIFDHDLVAALDTIDKAIGEPR